MAEGLPYLKSAGSGLHLKTAGRIVPNVRISCFANFEFEEPPCNRLLLAQWIG